MYKRRRRRHIVMPVLAGLLTLATLGSTAFAAPVLFPPAGCRVFQQHSVRAECSAGRNPASAGRRHGRGRSAHGAAYR